MEKIEIQVIYIISFYFQDKKYVRYRWKKHAKREPSELLEDEEAKREDREHDRTVTRYESVNDKTSMAMSVTPPPFDKKPRFIFSKMKPDVARVPTSTKPNVARSSSSTTPIPTARVKQGDSRRLSHSSTLPPPSSSFPPTSPSPSSRAIPPSPPTTVTTPKAASYAPVVRSMKPHVVNPLKVKPFLP